MENENKFNGITENDTESGIPDATEISNEVTELRGKNSKVFRMDDGKSGIFGKSRKRLREE